MKKLLKWIGIVLGGLAVLIIVAAVGLSIAGEAKLKKTRQVQAESITVPADAAALARGEHLVTVACLECHGENLAGQPIMNDPAIATIYAANITGLSQTHSDADIVRAIRHGLDTDGRQLIIMPAEAFIHFSEEDLGAVIAYLKTVPRTGDDRPLPRLGVMGRMLMGAGAFGNIFPAEYIDHNMPFPAMPEVGANAEYGEYLSRFCTSCHGPELAGGQPGDPESPPAPNLTPGSHLASWSEADFIRTIRSGVTPEGRQLDPAFMPWKSFAKFDDDELKALWLHLSSLPPR